MAEAHGASGGEPHPDHALQPAPGQPIAGAAPAGRQQMRVLRRHTARQMRRAFRLHQAAGAHLPPQPHRRAGEDTQPRLPLLPPPQETQGTYVPASHGQEPLLFIQICSLSHLG